MTVGVGAECRIEADPHTQIYKDGYYQPACTDPGCTIISELFGRDPAAYRSFLEQVARLRAK